MDTSLPKTRYKWKNSCSAMGKSTTSVTTNLSKLDGPYHKYISIFVLLSSTFCRPSFALTLSTSKFHVF